MDIERIQDRNAKQEATKRLVEGMKKEGREMLLPYRLSFIKSEESAPVSFSGRGKKPRVAKLKAQFTRNEQSPNKIAKPYEVFTSVWSVEGRKNYYYGVLGVTMIENCPVQDNSDLVIIRTLDWREIDVFVFRGLAIPNATACNEQAVEYVSEHFV